MTYWAAPCFFKQDKIIDIKEVIEVSNNYFGFDTTICRRYQHIVDARKFVCKFLYSQKFTLKEIGIQFGQDHTTVINAINKLGQFMQTDEVMVVNYNKFEKHLKANI